jgi:hypothetical protein
MRIWIMHFFNHYSAPGGAQAWEQGGRFYERMFGIKRWKD